MPDTIPGALSGHPFALWNSPLEEAVVVIVCFEEQETEEPSSVMSGT